MEKKKMNDKGFSLVELIIVIAIMAILVAVLAPQYLKFVERSRKSADMDTVDQLIRAVQIDAADPETANSVHNAKITISTTGATVTEGAGGTALGTVLTNAGLDLTSIKLKSAKWKVGDSTTAVSQVVITFTESGDNVTATVTANATTDPVVNDSATPKTTITGGNYTP